MIKPKLPLDKALKYVVPQIEKDLGTEIYSITRITKVYGSNANSFLLKSVDDQNQITSYFLKFANSNMTSANEVEGVKALSPYIPSPKIILSSNQSNFRYPQWELFENIDGKLMSEIFLEENKKPSSLLELEQNKESLLLGMYKETKNSSSYKKCLDTKTNNLFQKRLFGKQYKRFYVREKSNISSYFDYTICLNDKVFKSTINEAINSIREKYKKCDKKRLVTTYLGHGDAHHGNIIITEKRQKIVFIDFEYFGQIPIFMELAKPYYNDFLGFMFFTHQQLAGDFFHIEKINQEGKKINLKIKPKKMLKNEIALTKIKLKSRNDLINSPQNIDFLLLNDYLILCHILTKNPNLYPPSIQALFLAFTLILAEFDPFSPESIYSFF